MRAGSLEVLLGLDASKFESGIKKASASMDKLGRKMQSVGKNLTVGLTLPLGLAGAAAIKLASDFDESMNKVDVSFGDAAGSVKEFSKTTLKQFGIAQGTALDMAATFGDMGTSMGLNQQQAAKMSKEMVGLAGDLASFKNISIDIANTALTAVFTGETESLKRLGIVMTEANLQAFALSQGIKTQVNEMTQAEKTNLRFQYVMANTTNAQGDFARTSGGAANQMRIFQEGMKQLGQQIGSVIIPTFTKLVQKVNDIVGRFSEMNDRQRKLIVIIGGVAAAIGPLLFVMGGFLKVVGPLITAIRALNVTMLANPALAVAAAIAALVAGLIYLYNTSDDVREVMDEIGVALNDIINEIKPLVVQVANDLQPAFEEVVKVVKTGVIFYFTNLLKVIQGLVEGIGWLIEKFNGLNSAVKSLGGRLPSLQDALLGPLSSIIGLGKALGIGSKEMGEFKGAVKGVAGTLPGLATALLIVKKAQQEVTGGAKTFSVAVGKMAKSVKELPVLFEFAKSELQLLNGVIHEGAKPVDAMTRAYDHMVSKLSKGVEGGTFSLGMEGGDAAKEFEDQLDRMKTKAESLAGSIANTLTNAFSNFFAVLLNNEPMKAMEEEMAILREEVRRGGEGAAAARERMGELKMEMQDFKDSKVGEAFKAFGKTILQVLAQIIKDLIAATIKALIFKAIIGAVTGGAGAAVGSIGSLIKGFLGFAHGGLPPVNKPSIVGENGPEMFVPSTSGRIVPNHQMGSGGGQVAFEIRGDVLYGILQRHDKELFRRG